MQDGSNSIANALDLLQSCTKASICLAQYCSKLLTKWSYRSLVWRSWNSIDKRWRILHTEVMSLLHQLGRSFLHHEVHLLNSLITAVIVIITLEINQPSWQQASQHGGQPFPPPDKMAAILADDKFKCISVNESYRNPIQISLKFVPKSPIDNNPSLT